jgi:hypothetical protein
MSYAPDERRPPNPYPKAKAALDDGRVICQRCGATYPTYLDGSTCKAPLDGRCEGFETVEAALGA